MKNIISYWLGWLKGFRTRNSFINQASYTKGFNDGGSNKFSFRKKL